MMSVMKACYLFFCRYYDQLCSMEAKLPIAEDQVGKKQFNV